MYVYVERVVYVLQRRRGGEENENGWVITPVHHSSGGPVSQAR